MRVRRRPAGYRGRTAQGVMHTRRGDGELLARPEAFEGVAVVCCCSSVAAVDTWTVARWSERIKSKGRKGMKGNKKKVRAIVARTFFNI